MWSPLLFTKMLETDCIAYRASLEQGQHANATERNRSQAVD
jgi:hypothetical protein